MDADHPSKGVLFPRRITDIAAAAVFLASDDAGDITGHTLNVDGGFLAAGLMFPFDPRRDRPIAEAGFATDPTTASPPSGLSCGGPP